MKANNYTGKNFEWEIRKSLDKFDCWWFRIQDTNDVSRFVKKAIAEKQPGDFFAVKDGRPILIECKTSRNKTSFPLYYNKTPAIPEHQIKYGKDLIEEGGEAWFFIRKDEPRNKRVFALTPYELDMIYCHANKKSVKWEIIETIGTELPRLSKPVRYDLTELLNTNKDSEEND
jgi:penicillin-binding protein-related factor A (putative recombinase)